MKRFLAVKVLFVMLVCMVLVSVAGAAQVEFGITAIGTKVGDGNSSSMYGEGLHNVVVDGTNVYAAYIIKNASNVYEVRLGVSNDGGNTWPASKLIAYGSNIGYSPGIDVGSDGLIHVVWTDRGAGSTYSTYYESGNISIHERWAGNGKKIVSDTISVEDWTATISISDPSGVHISYVSSGTLYYSRSVDNGASFATPEAVPGVSCYSHDAVADSNGKFHVVCEDSYTNTLFYKNRTSGGAWSTSQIINTVRARTQPSIAVSSTNDVYIAWDGWNDLYVSMSSDNFASPELVATGWGGWASIVVDVNDVVNIATYDSLFRGSKNGNNWSWNGPILINPKSQLTAIDVDANGKVIAFYDYSRSRAVFASKEQ